MVNTLPRPHNRSTTAGLPVEIDVGWQPVAVARGMALGLGVALLFALRPLVDAMRVPPIRVLRRDADPLPMSRVMGAVLALVLWALGSFGLRFYAVAFVDPQSVYGLLGMPLVALLWCVAGAALLRLASRRLAGRGARRIPRAAGPLRRREGSRVSTAQARHRRRRLRRPGRDTHSSARRKSKGCTKARMMATLCC